MGSCAWCKRRIKQAATGRPRLYCSGRCKQHAYDRRRLDAAERAGREQAREEVRTPPFLA